MNLLRKSLLLLPIVLTATTVQAESLPFNCPAGGTVSASYTWDPVSGSITYNATSTNCTFGSGSVTGTTTGTGTLKKAASSQNYDVNLTTTKNFSVGGPRDFTGSYVCTVTTVGTVDGATGTFTGTITKNNCAANGTLTNVGGIYRFLINPGD